MSRKFLTPVVLPADPTAPLEAATKQYVDTKATVSSVNTQTGAVVLDSDDILTSPAWGSGSIEAVLNFIWGETVKVQQSVIISTTDPIAANPNAELWFDPDA